MNNNTLRGVLGALSIGVLAGAAYARDEGMWLFTSPPRQILKDRYGFEPSAAWLEHVQKSAVRFSTGGSGSLISADGLVMTNHHVGSDMLVKLSTASRDLLETGYYARTRAEELKCPDLELNVLWKIEDVTAEVNAGVTSGMSDADASTARQRAIAGIAKRAQDDTKLKCEVVTLYQGARYHLYCYKRYTDVRLVFAPEQQIAYFGGDADNFEFPRFNLDASFFRIYEDGLPIQPEHFLTWSAGAKAGDLALVAGHPGSTQRLYTTDHLKFLRDTMLPERLRQLWRAENKAQAFMGRSAENQRIGAEDFLGFSNSRKAFTGQLAGLLDPAIMQSMALEERELREAVAANPAWSKEWGDAWDVIAKAEHDRVGWFRRWFVFERGLRSDLLGYAKDVVRLADELGKPNSDRLREFRDSALPSLYTDLYSPAPVHESLEIERIESSLSLMAEMLGGDDPSVVTALAGKSPRARAEELVLGTSLKDPAARKKLVDGGTSALAESKDPLLAFWRSIDAEARTIHARYESEVEAAEQAGYAKIAAAKFAVEGENTYPDATFTLRLAFGPIEGYEQDGKEVPPFTDFAGLYERFNDRKGQAGFELPERWLRGKGRLDLTTPFNFVCAADIIGGNSGSPVINTKGELIGLIFDGNIQSLVGAFKYDGTLNRAVAVDSRAIIESLRKLYDAGPLVDEIMGKER